MTRALRLIMVREFRTYVSTASFWIALFIGPLVLIGGAVLARDASGPVPVTVSANDTALVPAAIAALNEAAAIEGRNIVIVPSTHTKLSVSRAADGALQLDFANGFPLSAAGRALLGRIMESEAARTQLLAMGSRATVVHEANGRSDASDPDRLTRFTQVMILWFALAGSLGMLLQAVARERSNRALEMLLAAADPWEIVGGKLLGVGAVSCLVLAGWLISAALASSLAAAHGHAPSAAGATMLLTVARAAIIYVLAFAFYGLVTVAIGASARDSTTAQTLARPLFAVLLVVFFFSLTSLLGRSTATGWLVYLPPFTPFLLLLSGSGQLSALTQSGALIVMLTATAVAGRIATSRITLSRG